MNEYTPTTKEIRGVFIEGSYHLKHLDIRPDHFDRWIGEELSRARSEGYMLGKRHGWDEGFDAGEQDVFLHKTFDEPCIQNPYRKEEK